MMVGTLEGRLLTALVAMLRPRSVLEIGTFTGYSALSMAEALPADGRIITCDISEEHLAIARRHIAASPYAGGDRDPVRPGAGDHRDACRAVRPRLHRRRQDQLLGLLRGHPGQARTRRRDPGRQRAVERPGARPRRSSTRTPRPSRRSTTRCSPTTGRGGDADRARRRQPDPAPSSRPSRLRSARSRSAPVKTSAVRPAAAAAATLAGESSTKTVRGRVEVVAARAAGRRPPGRAWRRPPRRTPRCPRTARGSRRSPRRAGTSRPTSWSGPAAGCRPRAARSSSATVPSTGPPRRLGNRAG